LKLRPGRSGRQQAHSQQRILNAFKVDQRLAVFPSPTTPKWAIARPPVTVTTGKGLMISYVWTKCKAFR
jgi:hypothetical protein